MILTNMSKKVEGMIGGKLSHAIQIEYKQCLTGFRTSHEIKEYVNNSTECKKSTLFSLLTFGVQSRDLAHLICEKSCNCDDCLQDLQQFWSNAEVKINASYVKHTEEVREFQQRSVSKTERESIQKAFM